MRLNVAKLENVRQLAGGGFQARCPACAEGGQDKTGNHLRILPDGRFGCCVHPKDGEHRKRVFALAGDNLRLPSHGVFTMRLTTPMALTPPQSVKAALTGFNLGTPGTGKIKSEKGVLGVPDMKTSSLGTLGTPLFNPYEYRNNTLYMCKDLGSGVPGVPKSLQTVTTEADIMRPSATGDCDEPALRLPFLTPGGDLVIPFDSDPKYHWWKGGQSVAQTRAEAVARMEAERCGRDGSAKLGQKFGGLESGILPVYQK